MEENIQWWFSILLNVGPNGEKALYLLIHHHPLKLLFFCVHSVVGWEVYFVCKESSPRAVRGQCVCGGIKGES